MRIAVLMALVTLITLAVAPLPVAYGDAPSPASAPEAVVVVANRGSGSISLIGVRSKTVLETIDLPQGPGDNLPEPMYVVFSAPKLRVFVGDRANDRVVVYRAKDFSVEATISVGAGVFHMWANPRAKQLWVNGDVDNTSTVIDIRTLEVLATVPTPPDLVAQGGKPHDVILDPTRAFAYVTVLGLPGPEDYVVKYSTDTFEEVARAAVGKDPHLSVTPRNRLLYVPCQSSDAVYVLNRHKMTVKTIIPVPGAHGAGMTRNGRTFYTTNLTGGGADAIWAIDTQMNEVIPPAVDTPLPVPHNIALTPNGKTLFLTHSGATADQVTIFKIPPGSRTPVYLTQVTVGLNPFGLVLVPISAIQ